MGNGQQNYIEISSTSSRVLHSGCVHSFDSKYLKFIVGNLQIEFVFKEDGKEPDISIDVKGETSLQIVLTNFSNPNGVGTDVPINLGIMGGRQLSLAFTVQALSKDSIKLLSYTFFLGDDL